MSDVVDRSRTPFFAGADEATTNRRAAREVAMRLAPAHEELGYAVLFSAASFVIRDGRAPKDAPVLEEARRRMRWVNAAVDRRARRFARKDEAA